jgi:hypothetical protein
MFIEDEVTPAFDDPNRNFNNIVPISLKSVSNKSSPQHEPLVPKLSTKNSL